MTLSFQNCEFRGVRNEASVTLSFQNCEFRGVRNEVIVTLSFQNCEFRTVSQLLPCNLLCFERVHEKSDCVIPTEMSLCNGRDFTIQEITLFLSLSLSP